MCLKTKCYNCGDEYFDKRSGYGFCSETCLEKYNEKHKKEIENIKKGILKPVYYYFEPIQTCDLKDFQNWIRKERLDRTIMFIKYKYRNYFTEYGYKLFKDFINMIRVEKSHKKDYVRTNCLDSITQCLSRGFNFTETALAIGVNPGTFSTWKKTDRKIKQAVEIGLENKQLSEQTIMSIQKTNVSEKESIPLEQYELLKKENEKLRNRVTELVEEKLETKRSSLLHKMIGIFRK